MAKKVCHACGQKIKEAHKEQINKHKLTMLQTVATHVTRTGINNFGLAEIFDKDTNSYNNFQKLRYHGLVHHVKENGIPVPGRWLVTRNGWRFLRGDLELSKYVMILDNTIVEHSPDTIDVKSVYRGSEYIATIFEYFDDEGRPTAVRPLPRARNINPNQVRLFQ